MYVNFVLNSPLPYLAPLFLSFTPLALKHKFHKPGSQAIIEMSCKNLSGYACPVHYKKLFHHQGGYYNSFNLQATDLPPQASMISSETILTVDSNYLVCCYSKH